MTRSKVPIVAVWVLSLSALLAAQVSGVSLPGQGRDPGIQQPTERRIPVGTSSISGTVVTADTGRPIQGARVNITGQATGGRAGMQSGLSRSVMTDANGQFSFPRVPSGTFTIYVSQNQFLQTGYGQKRPGAQPKAIQLADGQQMTVKIPMLRGAVISGAVTGPDGEPQRNAQVRAWRVDMSSGFRRLQANGYAQTDDRGVYRMFGLQPGDYFVSALPNSYDAYNGDTQSELVERAIGSGQTLPPAAAGLPPTVAVPIPPPLTPAQQQLTSVIYLQTYAPGSMVPSAATIVTVAGGEERTGVDVRVQLTQASNIQGVVSTPLDPGVMVQVTLVSDDATIDSPQANSARPDQTGVFTFRGVAPGTYTVFAQTVAAPAPMTIVYGQPSQPQQPQPVLTDPQKMWARTHVVVAGEPLVTTSLSLQPSRSISGVVLFEMERPPDLTRSQFMVTVGTAPSALQMYSPQLQAKVGPDGRFTVTGVPPGRFIVRVGGGALKSAVVSGQDTLDFPLEFMGDRDVTDAVLTVTDKITDLSGTLMDSSGKPAVDYVIIAAASDSRYWVPGSRRVVMTRPGPDGRYSFRSLPPGAYQIAALTDLDQGAQYDPEFLRTIARASVPVMIAEGAKVTQDLRVK